MATFGQRVTKLREATGSRLAFSKIVETAYSAVSAIENDQASIPANRMDAWIKALRIPSSEQRDFIKAAKRQRILLNLDPELQSDFLELLGDFRSRNREAARLLSAIALEAGERLPQKLKDAIALFQSSVKLPWEE